MNIEKIKSHIEYLKKKHKEYEIKIEEAYLHYDPDEVVKKLKVEKLQVRKEIEWLENEILNASGAVSAIAPSS